MANLDTMVSSDASSSLPVVRKIGIVDLKDVLAKGIEDFRAMPTHAIFLSIIYPVGAVVVRNAEIVGRGANWFLRHRDDAFHVFLYAPYEEKMRRTIAQGETEREATQLLESVDRERAAFVRKYYGKEWPDRSLYNLMMNTKVGDDAVIASILNIVDLLNK